MTKVNKWTLGLAALGLVSLPAMVQAEEKPNHMLTALSATTISGYVDTSAQWTLGNGNGHPPGYSFNGVNKQDGFNVNAVNVTIEKPLDEGTWSAGYKVELIYGPNAVGFNNSVGASSSDLAIKQAYVNLRVPTGGVGNGIEFKIGTFDTIIGYEVFNSGSNPNASRSYGYTFEPTQHTGILASYNVCKTISLAAGVANTWAAGINVRSGRTESDKTYMGSITLTAPESLGFLAGSSLSAGIVDGYNNAIFLVSGPNTGNDVTSYYVGASINTPLKALKLGAAFDYLDVHDNRLSPHGYAEAVGLYASIAPEGAKWSTYLRGEYAQANVATSGVPRELFAVTATLQYDLWANVLSRVELRWDHDLNDTHSYGGNREVGGNRDNEVTLAANFIYKF